MTTLTVFARTTLAFTMMRALRAVWQGFRARSIFAEQLSATIGVNIAMITNFTKFGTAAIVAVQLSTTITVCSAVITKSTKRGAFSVLAKQVALALIVV